VPRQGHNTTASAKTRAPGIFPQFRRHPLLGSSRLVINWGAIPQGGMQPPVIVIAKIASQREPQLPLGPEPRAVHHLGLQRVNERLHVRIVAWGPHSGRALPDAQARSRSRNAWAAYSLPRSLWKTSPARGR